MVAAIVSCMSYIVASDSTITSRLSMFRVPVRVLVKGLLQRHPNDRPDISLAATASQMLLWAPDLCMVNDQRRCLFDDVKR